MKLSLANRIPRDYNAATFQEIVRFLEEQSNLHAEGKLRARHGAMTAAPTIGNWEKGDFVWNSNPSVSSNRVIYGWLCTVSGTPGTWVEVGVSTAVLAATQAEQEAGSSTSVYATPGRQQFHPSSAKAWVQLTTSGGTPIATTSYNVSSITDTGVGLFRVNFTTAFSSSDYAAVGAASGENVGNYGIVETRHTAGGAVAAGTCGIRTATTGGAVADLPVVSVAFYGDQ